MANRSPRGGAREREKERERERERRAEGTLCRPSPTYQIQKQRVPKQKNNIFVQMLFFVVFSNVFGATRIENIVSYKVFGDLHKIIVFFGFLEIWSTLFSLMFIICRGRKGTLNL